MTAGITLEHDRAGLIAALLEWYGDETLDPEHWQLLGQAMRMLMADGREEHVSLSSRDGE